MDEDDKVFLLSIKELRDYVLDRGWDVMAALVLTGSGSLEDPYVK